ncbi:hypothetical protein [Paenarthrobacter aurescens]|uniref:hypothetical protein n=1 Tax=Paenarthrobacter aurescens TaxID=43663 RepID=UPI0021C2207D|nr:hypothetical protein [Paenarthrobacter aurescens]MCT9868350.1 hypothetical protein [Paenarthrobacter aurescens]
MTQQPMAPKPLINPQRWKILHGAHAAFIAESSPVYDEVLVEVAGRIEKSGSVGKADIGAMVLWKRVRADTRWVGELMAIPEMNVRAVTEKAVAAVNSEAVTTPQAASDGRRALATLPGLKTGDAFASALLLASAPHRMAVYDRRAQTGLKELGLTLSSKPGRYRRYMALVEELCLTAKHHGHTWIARDVDVALYKLGGPGTTVPTAS